MPRDTNACGVDFACIPYLCIECCSYSMYPYPNLCQNIVASIQTIQLHVSSFQSSKNINLDSQNAISKPKINDISNGELVLSL
jgi:hypothetical protein